RRKLSSKQFCRTAEPGGISHCSVGRDSASKRVPHHIRASFGMAKCNISPSQKGAYRPMQRVDSTRYDAPVLMDTRNFRSTRLTGIHCRRNISLAAQVFVRGMAIRFLFGGLLAGALVPPAIAQSSKASENPQDVFLSLRGTPSMGDPKASVAIVEFGDYQCPYCGEHANHTLPQIITDYIKTNNVCYFSKDFPIESLHPQAFKAAEAARCSVAQGKY